MNGREATVGLRLVAEVIDTRLNARADDYMEAEAQGEVAALCSS